MKKILSDAVYIGFSHIIVVVLLIALQVFVVRVTSLKTYGEYSSALAVISLVEAVFIARSGEMALQHVGKYWLAGDYASARIYGRQIARLDRSINGILYVVIALLALALSNMFNFNLQYLLVLALVIPAQTGYGVYKSLFISASKLKHQALFESLYTLLHVMASAVGVYLFSIPGLIVATVASAAAKTLIARQITNRWWPANASFTAAIKQKESLQITSWLGDSVHSVTRNFFVNAAAQADILVLNALKGAEAVAVYKVAKTLASLPVRITAPLWSALRPRIMQAWHGRDRKRLKTLILYPSLVIGGALLPAIWVISVWSGDIIVLFYGKDYSTANLPFVYLFVGSWIFSAMTAWFGFMIIISEQRVLGTLTYGFLFVVTLCSAVLYGGASAEKMAIAAAASMVAAAVVCWIGFVRMLEQLSKCAIPLGQESAKIHAD